MPRASYLRLMNPPGGIESSELEVVSKAGLRRRTFDRHRRIVMIDRWRARELAERKPVFHTNPHPIKSPLLKPPESLRPVEPPLIDASETPRLTVRDIAWACSRYYDIPMVEMLSHRRHKSLCRARQVAMYLAKKHTLRSLVEIGRLFANRDHTTVLHACRVIPERMASDDRLRDDVELIRLQLGLGGAQ